MKTIRLLPILILLTVLLDPQYCYAQADAGEIHGTIRDAGTGITLPGATVSYYLNGRLQGTYTDERGHYKIKPLPPGTYEISCSFTGYQKIIHRNIQVTSGGITFVDVTLSNDNNLPPVDIIVEREPLIRRDFTGGMTKILPEDISVSVERDIRGLVAQTAGVYQKEEGGSLNIRGSRESSTQYYVDGIKMIGGFSLPKSSILEITVISGGVPAQYGDATGGIVVITTKSASGNR